MAAKKKSKKAKKAAKKSRTASRPMARKTGKAKKKSAAKKKPGTAKSAKAAPARKATAKKAVKAKKKAPALKQIVGEGDYEASRAFLKDQSGFVAKNRAKIPAMGQAARAALEGSEGPALLAAEAEAKEHSKTGSEE